MPRRSRAGRKSAGIKATLLFVIIFLLSFVPAGFSNGLTISNVSIVSFDSTANTAVVQFTVSWSNGWRDQINYDGAWIFLKWRSTSADAWQHGMLKTSGTNPSGFSVTGNNELIVPSDKTGLFIQSAVLSATALSPSATVQVVWDEVDYDNSTNQNLEIKVLGIEMVYIPEGGFYVGDGSDGSAGQFEYGSTSSQPCAINSESGIDFKNDAQGSFYYNGGFNAYEDAGGAAFNVSESFPKGFHAFYIMKYEMSEGQWVDFFNMLNSSEKANHDITGSHAAYGGKNSDSVVNRNTVSWTSGNATTTRPDRACGYLSWVDLAAYADWAGLRPMTEFEYEKAARGPLYPVPDEYAWGTTSKTECLTTYLTGDGYDEYCTASSTPNVSFGNTTYTDGTAQLGPLRVGAFATEDSVTREAAGASYYGVMELSGNLEERVVTVGNSQGRGFSGTHGDGVLTTASTYEGFATNTDWPGINADISKGISNAAGGGHRGGDMTSTVAGNAAVSGRYSAASNNPSRLFIFGIRLVRTAEE